MPNLRDSWAVAVVCRLCRAQCRGVKTKDHKLRVSSAKTMAESQGWGRWKHGSWICPGCEKDVSRVAKAVVATKSPEGAARKLERPLSWINLRLRIASWRASSSSRLLGST